MKHQKEPQVLVHVSPIIRVLGYLFLTHTHTGCGFFPSSWLSVKGLTCFPVNIIRIQLSRISYRGVRRVPQQMGQLSGMVPQGSSKPGHKRKGDPPNWLWISFGFPLKLWFSFWTFFKWWFSCDVLYNHPKIGAPSKKDRVKLGMCPFGGPTPIGGFLASL